MQTHTRKTTAGSLEVTIDGSTGLQAIQVRIDGNTLVDLAPGMVTQYPNGVSGLTGTLELTPTNPSQDVTFTMRRRAPVSFTVQLAIRDTCGVWNSLAGAGSASL